MASKSRGGYLQYEEDSPKEGLLAAIKTALLRPIQPFLSHTALRAYITTFLLLSTVFVLLGCAIAAYVLLYWSYIPRIGFERTIHLQFDNVYKSHAATKRTEHPYPYGSVSLTPDLVSSQGYDIAIELDMPRTPENQDAGNFMLEVTMYAQDERRMSQTTPGDAMKLEITRTSTSEDIGTVLAYSRRHAIMPYRSWIVGWMHILSGLPWYFFYLRSETDQLRVPVFEKVAFAKGKTSLPATLHLEVQSTHRLQIYRAVAHFRARFTGLRWIMYNHRIIAASAFISAFWLTEVIFCGLAWAVVSYYISSPSQELVKAGYHGESPITVKREDDEDSKPALSDTERVFPTPAGQPPLRYSSSNADHIKKEEEEKEEEQSALLPVTPAAEADDEDEDADFFDSGIGTSMESSNPSRRDSVRKRRGRLPARPNLDDRAY